MPSELLQKQWKFAKMLPLLLAKVSELGYEYTEGDAFRDPRVHGELGVKKSYSHPNSAHKVKLAFDVNLFHPDGRFISDDTGHKDLHDFWDSIGGAPRIEHDMNHYSLEWNGVR